MKKIVILSSVLLLGLGTSCTDMLMEESRTSVTNNWLVTTPDGLSRMVVGLYERDRNILTDNDAELFCALQMDYCTDILLFNNGTASDLGRLSGLNASTRHFGRMWSHYYQIIGKANEVITAADGMDLNDPVVKKARGEAKVFRARSYFELYKRFERLYLNTVPTTSGNTDRVFKPSSKEAIFTLIKTDLKDAIDALEWADQPGRFTKAVAKHIRAQVAMWEDDWTTAIKECEDIFICPSYDMMDSAIDCFTGADLNKKENLYVYQFSANLGGGGSVTGGEFRGHRISLITTARYQSVTGMDFSALYGGYGWGRVYPNTYLLGLYDKEHDKRYQNMFRFKWHYNNPDKLPAGKKLGDEVVPKTADEYIQNLHPMSLKYLDSWTRPDMLEVAWGFKDVVVYRLAETYLMAAEAYYHRDGGSSTKALDYYNETWERAGNERFNGPLTIDILLDEYARELHLEGVRWSLLKRLGMLERVALHGGDTPAEDPLLRERTDLTQQRTNFQPKHYTWPIPQSEIDFMGVKNFPQNENWL